MLDRFNQSLKLALLLPFMLLVVSPLSFYYGNISKISFLLPDIYKPVLIVALLFALILLMLQMAIVKYRTLSDLFGGLLLGSAIAVWMQSQLFVWDFGPLDGRGIEWSAWKAQMIFEGVAWTAIISLCIYLFAVKKPVILNICINGVFLLGILSIVTAFAFTPPKQVMERNDIDERIEQLFHFHPENNVIVIMLDSFQSDHFEVIAKNNPESVDFLDDFVFHRNTTGKYPTTGPSLPAIMTGQIYDNTVPFSEYTENAYARYDLREAFSEKKYASETVHPSPDIVPGSLLIDDILNAYDAKGIPKWAKFIDYGLFRGLPSLASIAVYRDGNWFLSYRMRRGYPPQEHGNDINFLELFEKQVAIKQSDQKGAFRFFHFYLPHMPLRVNDALQYDKNLDGVKGYRQQAMGALKIAERMLQALHKLNLYDSAEIFIMSDHGTLTIPPVKSIGETSAEILYAPPLRAQSSALSLMLHKKPGAAGRALQINDTPLYIHELSCMVTMVDIGHECIAYKAAVRSGERKRRYLFYDWGHEFWKREFMPPMTEYFIKGHAYDILSWSRGKHRYLEGQKIEFKAFSVEPGQRVMFSSDGQCSLVVRGGWSAPEPSHRWTEGAKAGMVFNLQNAGDKNFQLRLKASAYRGKDLSHQEVGLSVNGEQVENWKIKRLDWYEADIPDDIIEDDGLVEVLLTISDPLSPLEAGESKDSRRLGIAVRELQIVAKK